MWSVSFAGWGGNMSPWNALLIKKTKTILFFDFIFRQMLDFWNLSFIMSFSSNFAFHTICHYSTSVTSFFDNVHLLLFLSNFCFWYARNVCTILVTVSDCTDNCSFNSLCNKHRKQQWDCTHYLSSILIDSVVFSINPFVF